MASTPSASALSAVLRCRGNILTRNPPTKRPATAAAAAYSLGRAAERSRSNPASTWETFLRGERVVIGKRVSAAYAPVRTDDKLRGKIEPRSQWRPWAGEDAQCAAPAVQNALLVRQVARKLIPKLPGRDKSSQLIPITMRREALQFRKTLLLQELSESPSGLLKVSVSVPYSKSGQIRSLVSGGWWSTLKTTCLLLTALVSERMFTKVSSTHTVTHPPVCRQEAQALQTNTQDLSSSSSSGRKITEDGPD
ncbi:uncharacterized protein LOC143000814 [Genypterus blacodes]|uniref:uncharacterized protein LOC143000814 n=1 Tax=Genypterus blacodes TaxID=154954 RepID=UPI003F75CCA7